MKMLHRLAGVGSGVRHQTEAVCQSLALRELGGHLQNVTGQRAVLFRALGDVRHMRFRDDQDMYGRLRIDIPERVAPIVLIHLVRRNLSRNNLAEKATVRCISPPLFAENRADGKRALRFPNAHPANLARTRVCTHAHILPGIPLGSPVGRRGFKKNLFLRALQ